MNIVDRYIIEAGSKLDLTSTPKIYISGEETTFTNCEISDISSAEYVDVLDYRKYKPTDAVKVVKYTSNDKGLLIFLDSNNEAISPAYLVRPKENWIEFSLGPNTIEPLK